MQLLLSQLRNPSPKVRAWGISATDPYVEICWSRAGKPRAALLASCVARLAPPDGERTIDAGDLWDALGEDPASDALAEDLLLEAAMDIRTQQLGLLYPTAADGSGQWLLAVRKTVPLVPMDELDRLHDVELAHHVATVHNINERIGSEDVYAVELPEWVYWRAGVEGTDADLGDVRDALFNRGLPDWPSFTVNEAGSARGLTPPVGPSGGPKSSLAIPGWEDLDISRPSDAGKRQHAGNGVERAAGQQLHGGSTGDCLVYVGDHMWRRIADDSPRVREPTQPGEVAHWEGRDEAGELTGTAQGAETADTTDPTRRVSNPATDAAQRRLNGLCRRDPTTPGLGL